VGADTSPRFTSLAGLLDEWRDDAESRHDALVNHTPRGPVTGFKYLDEELGHALQTGLHYITGTAGVGKTALALKIAATCGAPAVFVSAEMGLLELFRRHTARVTGTFLRKLKSGELLPEDSLRLAREAAEAAPFLTLVDATRAYASPAWLRERAIAIRQQAETRHVLIVIDSIHSWAEGAPEPANEYEALNTAIASLRNLAHSLDAPVLAIAEQNRASMGKGGISTGAGTRKIEYGAETVISLRVNDKIAPSPSGETAVLLTLEKNRNGTVGRTFNFTFDGALQRHTEAL
jgi:replicative DNA helicase